jgi:outer membrane murein-binding lipoprotein Lpp
LSTVRRLLPAVAAGALLLAGCGGGADRNAKTPAAERPSRDLAAVKDYLLEHTAKLDSDVAALRKGAEAYYAMAKEANFDYAKLLATRRADVRKFVETAQKDFAAANPAYEQMEGIVAGVPSLADYDVMIDAGGDASDPATAVPFSIKTPDGRTFKQPGNFNFLVETSIFGTEPKFDAKGVKPDLDGDRKVEFGEAMPDANFYLAALREFERTTGELDAAARKWQPTQQDAFTALVVMTPTMSDMFDAWKNSRFVAGDKATEKAFVVSSRLQDIADILGGLDLIYESVKPQIASVSSSQASQTGESLDSLHDFAAKLRDEETGGRKFSADEAETLGSEAQSRAEAIAGQISQAAGKLQIPLEN